MQSKFIFTYITFLCFFLLSCKNEPQGLIENEINDQLVINFGKSIEESIVNADVDSYMKMFSKEGLVSKIDKLNYKSGSFKRGFIQGVTKAVQSLPQRIINETQDGYYDFVNYRYDYEAQTYKALFRFYNPYSGVNYHDYELMQNANSQDLLFSDMYIYVSGESFSDTIARLFNASTNQDKNSVDEDFIKLGDIAKLNNEGRYSESLNLAYSVGYDLGKDKFFMILKTIIASNISDDEYLKTLEELISEYGDDPTIYLNKIDYLLYKKDYNGARENINLLMKETEDDFLRFLIGNAYYNEGDFESAQSHFKYIIDNYEGFFVGQTSYLSTITSLGQYDQAVNYLNELVYEYDKDALIEYIEEPEEDGTNIFEGFIESDSFKKWKD